MITAEAATTAPVGYVHTSEVAPDPTRFPRVRFEVSADPDFTKRFGAKIKALGGRYSECRGGNFRGRSINVPVTPDAIALIDRILSSGIRPASSMHKKRDPNNYTFIFEPPADLGAGLGNALSWVTVQDGLTFADAARAFVRAYENAVSRGIAPSMAQIWQKREAARIAAVRLTANTSLLAALDGIEPDDNMGRSFILPLPNGLRLRLNATENGIGIEGLSYGGDRVRYFEISEVLSIAKALGAAAI